MRFTSIQASLASVSLLSIRRLSSIPMKTNRIMSSPMGDIGSSIFHGHINFHDLQIPRSELRADFTLIMGQCFNWRKLPCCDEACWVGCLGDQPMAVLSTDTTTYVASLLPDGANDVDALRTQMRAYFQIEHDLNSLYHSWAKSCDRMNVVTERLPGVRVLQQDPFECLISFICSSNNNIKRITQMLDKLKYRYGRYICSISHGQHEESDHSISSWAVSIESPDHMAAFTNAMLQSSTPSKSPASSSSSGMTTLDDDVDVPEDGDLLDPNQGMSLGFSSPAPSASSSSSSKNSKKRPRSESSSAESASQLDLDHSSASPVTLSAATTSSTNEFSVYHFFEFPSIDSLAQATEAELRSLGMGYRARFIKGTAELLAAKPGGGAQWLLDLRGKARESPSSRLEVQQALCEFPGIGRKVHHHISHHIISHPTLVLNSWTTISTDLAIIQPHPNPSLTYNFRLPNRTLI